MLYTVGWHPHAPIERNAPTHATVEHVGDEAGGP
jgi:hypothetical protein